MYTAYYTLHTTHCILHTAYYTQLALNRGYSQNMVQSSPIYFRAEKSREQTSCCCVVMSSAATELQERVFEAEWDEEGVYFYQAFNDAIADWALEHQR